MDEKVTVELIRKVFLDKGYPIEDALILSEMTFQFFDLGLTIGKRVGAKEELEKILFYLAQQKRVLNGDSSKGFVYSRDYEIYIEKRLKELEA
jgi:hypothetical protein